MVAHDEDIVELQEKDAMICRSCGREERASEGYPCERCGTFVCQMCNMRGVRRCKACEALGSEEPPVAAS